MTHKLVPIEPTEEMIEAGRNASITQSVSRIYAAMIYAAPTLTIPADDREAVARAIFEAEQNFHEHMPDRYFKVAMAEYQSAADAAISTLIARGWGKK